MERIIILKNTDTGQALTLPDKDALTGYAATPAPSITSTTKQQTWDNSASNSGGSTKTAYEEARAEQFAQRKAQARAEARSAIGLK